MNVVAIMPTYNQEKFLEAAVQSVVRQVDQLVIVDDGSTDGTVELMDMLASYYPNIVVTSNPRNLGTAQTINAGARIAAKSRWRTWVSSDNVHTDDWTGALLDAADENTGAVYSAFNYCVPGKPKRKLGMPYKQDRLISQEACYFGPSFLIRTDMWRAHRGLISHDYDNWLRVEEACWASRRDILYVEKPLCDYRAHRERATVRKRHQYDVPKWRKAAKDRRSK